MKKTPDLMDQMKETEKSTTQKVYEIILDDPGVSCRHISERISVPGKKVSFSLAYLRRTGKINNRGKQARGASWYPVG